MIRVKKLKEFLAALPDSALVYAYEGECIVVVPDDDDAEVPFWSITATDRDIEEGEDE